MEAMENYFSDEEISTLTVKDLRDYLRKHGQMVTGNKTVLCERATGVRKLKLRLQSDVNGEDFLQCNRRWIDKLTTPLGEIIPDPRVLQN